MDAERVAVYLQHAMPDAREIEVSQLWRIPGGASRETWSCDATWREGKARHGRGLILRRDPEASLLETERYVEFRVYGALQGTGVPVPFGVTRPSAVSACLASSPRMRIE